MTEQLDELQEIEENELTEIINDVCGSATTGQLWAVQPFLGSNIMADTKAETLARAIINRGYRNMLNRKDCANCVHAENSNGKDIERAIKETATAIGITLLCLFPEGKMFTVLDKNEVVKIINKYGVDLRKLEAGR